VVFCFDGNTTVSLDVNTTAASRFARGSGLTAPDSFTGSTLGRPNVCTAANTDVSSQNWSPTRTADKYYEFKINHGPGRYTISFAARRSGGGPRVMDVVSNGTNLETAFTLPDGQYVLFTWTGELAGGENTIRVYGYGDGTASGGTFRIDNFHLRPASL
jgi:hypothetical protein